MSNYEALKRANLSGIVELLRTLKFEDVVASGIPVYKRKINMTVAPAGTSTRQLATVHQWPAGVLDKAPASAILRATARAGAVTGELTPVAYGVTPATTQIAVAPNGDIVVLAADAITDLDIVYIPEKVEVVDLVLPVIPATGVCAIPAGYVSRGVVLLMDAVAIEGTVTGQKRVLIPGAANPATPQARLSVAKDAVNFTAADAVSMARIKIGVASADVPALLQANESVV